MAGKYCFAIDRGGTFTDVLCICPDGKVKTLKLLSEDPARYDDAPREGIRRILQNETGNALTLDELIDTSLIGWVRMGTTVATNALLERKGDPVVLVVNKGLKDLLFIGNQARSKIFDLNIKKPSNLYKKVIEINCRIIPEHKGWCQLEHSWKTLEGTAGSKYLEKSALDHNEIKEKLKKVLDEGISSIAVVLAHSYACSVHEMEIGSIASELGFTHITLSHQAMPMCRLVARGYTACAEAYLTPHVERYLKSFKQGFQNQLAGVDVLFMQSDGGLTKMENFRGARAILSGPAGGVVGYAVTGSRETDFPLIGFDMGGTSTDVSRFNGNYEHVIESTTAGITIQAPQLDINTVAAGGGSRLFFRSGLFVVGPESAGAHPGPSCYKKGGPLTVTDANLILGRLLPQYFPKIFGSTEKEPLDYEATRLNFEILQSEINNYLKERGEKETSLEEIAIGFIRVANEAMCRPIRALTQSRGLDTSKHVLACFGGAGGQHACSIARELGMSKVVIHKYAGILSAYGMALADVVRENQEPCGLEFNEENSYRLAERLQSLSDKCKKDLQEQGFQNILLEPYLHLRYEGTDCALMCSPKTYDSASKASNILLKIYGDFNITFIERYKSEFGFILQNRRILVDDIRVRGTGKNVTPPEKEIPTAKKAVKYESLTNVYFEDGFHKTPIYLTSKLFADAKISGPAILIDDLSTILIEPNCNVEVTKYGNLVIHVGSGALKQIDCKLNAVQLSIFSHRFMSIAEQMGRVLQRTSISTNIKERLDFSCALFGPDGGLVSNAPHIPVHLGAMQETVQYQLKGFQNQLAGVDVLFMQSDGGLTKMENFRGARAILSGPAGGVVGYAVTGSRETDFPLIGFDMGGTSTDVSRFNGNYEHVIESTTAGITIQAPQLDINTVAAGGGSRLFFRSGLFVVGPESAGAHPGPSCYKKGGPLTVTDANLILGRLLPQYFPKIFGSTEKEPLDYEATRLNFEILQSEINNYLKERGEKETSLEEIAIGFIRVANEAMCRPIRALTQSRGLDTSKHVLACFGGAGGQHACSIARELGMSKVVIHKYAGILSAYGMALADVVRENQEPCGLEFNEENSYRLAERLQSLSDKCKKDLQEQGFQNILLEPYLHLRYEGTDCALMCSPKTYDSASKASNILLKIYGDFNITFIERYKSEFGFILQNRRILVDDIRVRGTGKNVTPPEKEIPTAKKAVKYESLTNVYFEDGFHKTPIYLTSKLFADAKISGPAILIDDLSTILIEPNCNVEVTKYGNLVIHVGSGALKQIDCKLNAVQLSIFSHRFMSIAEQMGRVLQRTSISTNIKERLDFSCALFGPDGGLVSNAPHIPVHLGAMQETVQYQLKVRGNTLKNGDVLLSNHPQAGGSHLPDLTVITPVFYKNEPKPVFFVASRGHHADIGGITPGSMPPHSTSLAQEGAAFKSFFLLKEGVFQENEIINRLTVSTGVKGATGTRNLTDNISDLKAQIAANHKGIQLVCELIDVYGLDVVQAYMNFIQENAEIAVRDMLKEIAKNCKGQPGSIKVLNAEERMDDGSPICLKVLIDESKGSAICDFTGSGFEVWGNCNAPRAVTLSALIYCLRCMVGHDVPLNQGCLVPIKCIIPKNSILDPSDGAAVVGGNVLTSQRVVDVVLKAFQVCAASQGCMNNITIGDDKWGYYETVAGGSGAGPYWHGVGGVHSHMTNTRITDPEILELRYPIILNKFCLRDDQSGGAGAFNGGEGVQRELLFRKPVTLSVLTERRTLEPYGMNGGQPAKRGVNLLIKTDGRIICLGSKTAVDVNTGEIFSMKTPGGGGYGKSKELVRPDNDTEELCNQFTERGSVFEYRQAQESV